MGSARRRRGKRPVTKSSDTRRAGRGVHLHEHRDDAELQEDVAVQQREVEHLSDNTCERAIHAVLELTASM